MCDRQTVRISVVRRIWIWAACPNVRMSAYPCALQSEVLRRGTCDNEALATFAYRQFAIRLRLKYPIKAESTKMHCE